MKHTIAAGAPVTCMRGEPLSCYQRWLAGREPGASSEVLLVEFNLEPYWCAGAPPISLTALYCLKGQRLHITVTQQGMELPCLAPLQLFDHLLARYSLIDYGIGAPVRLLPELVPKPWGREVWYTGVEQRAVCCFGDQGAQVPIPWLRAVVPMQATGDPGEPLLLLKILDPVPQPVLGDLYFELHELKREVYVVTHIDELAWPGGVGYVRYGFDPAGVAASGSEEQFRADYLGAVQAYEVIRRALDGHGAESGATAELQQREQQLREKMDSFTSMRPVVVGDVIEVPPYFPHSLQHGVRVVEFQTPVYERQILSFGQKVLTQAHWDTASAVAKMRLDTPAPAVFTSIPGAGVARLERIADFPDFELLRASLESGGCWQFEARPVYCVVLVVSGQLLVGGQTFRVEEALLLPTAWAGELVALESASPLVLLIALPRS